MSASFTELRRAKAPGALRKTFETKVMRSTHSKYLRFSELQSVASLAEQDPYYMARATALHGSCCCCRTERGAGSL